MSASPLRHVAAQFDSGIGDVRAYRGFRAIQLFRHILRRASFDVPQYQRGALAPRQQPQPILEIFAMLRAQYQLFGRLVLTLSLQVHLAVGHAPMAPQEVDSRVRRDPRKPVRRLLLVLELILPLQSLDKGFLRQVLGIGDVAHDPVDLEEDAPQVVGDKAVLSLSGLERRGYQFAHDLAKHHSRPQKWMTLGAGKRGDYFTR